MAEIESSGSVWRESTKYRDQANHYENDKTALCNILDSLKTTTDSVEEMLTGAYTDAQNDYFTNKIGEGNENIVKDIDEIKAKLESVAGSLSAEARRLDKIDTDALNANNDLTSETTE